MNITVRLYKFLNLEYGLRALSEGRLKVSRLQDLNDPFEFLGFSLDEKPMRSALQTFRTELSDKQGLLCFSKSWQNPVLWSHYADKHRGIALELDVRDEDVFHVQYSDSRLAADRDAVRTGGFSEEQLEALLATKFSHWSYEDEARVFVRLSDCRHESGLSFYPLGNDIRICGLVIGPNCILTDAEISDQLTPDSCIRVKTGRLAFRSFQVVERQDQPSRTVSGAVQQ